MAADPEQVAKASRSDRGSGGGPGPLKRSAQSWLCRRLWLFEPIALPDGFDGSRAAPCRRGPCRSSPSTGAPPTGPAAAAAAARPSMRPNLAVQLTPAQAFTDHYYATFDTARPNLAGLYQDQSMLTFEGQKFQGTQAVRRGGLTGGLTLDLEIEGCRSSYLSSAGFDASISCWLAVWLLHSRAHAPAPLQSACMGPGARARQCRCACAPDTVTDFTCGKHGANFAYLPACLCTHPSNVRTRTADHGQADVAAVPGVQASHQLAGCAAQPQRRRARLCHGAAAGEACGCLTLLWLAAHVCQGAAAVGRGAAAAADRGGC